MTQTYKVQVSMNQAHIVESGFVWKQGDFGFNIEIEVLDFDTTGATPQIIFRKSTGAVEATQISVAGNKFTYAIRGTELDTPGPCVCDLKLKDSTTKRVSTASFKYFVIPDTMDGLNQQASSYSDTIAQIVGGFDDKIETLQDSVHEIGFENKNVKSDGWDTTVQNGRVSSAAYELVPGCVFTVSGLPSGVRFFVLCSSDSHGTSGWITADGSYTTPIIGTYRIIFAYINGSALSVDVLANTIVTLYAPNNFNAKVTSLESQISEVAYRKLSITNDMLLVAGNRVRNAPSLYAFKGDRIIVQNLPSSIRYYYARPVPGITTDWIYADASYEIPEDDWYQIIFGKLDNSSISVSDLTDTTITIERAGLNNVILNQDNINKNVDDVLSMTNVSAQVTDYVDGWIGNNGVIQPASSASYPEKTTSEYFSAKVGDVFGISIRSERAYNHYLEIALYDSSKNFISRSQLAGSETAATFVTWENTLSNVAFVRFSYRDFCLGLTSIKIVKKAADYVYKEYKNQFIITSGSTVDITSISNFDSWYCILAECKPKDKFVISGHGGGSGRLWCFIDASGNVLSVSPANETLIASELIAPASAAYLIFNTSTLSDYALYKGELPVPESYLRRLKANTPTVLEPGDLLAKPVAAYRNHNIQEDTTTVNTKFGILKNGNNFCITYAENVLHDDKDDPDFSETGRMEYNYRYFHLVNNEESDVAFGTIAKIGSSYVDVSGNSQTLEGGCSYGSSVNGRVYFSSAFHNTSRNNSKDFKPLTCEVTVGDSGITIGTIYELKLTVDGTTGIFNAERMGGWLFNYYTSCPPYYDSDGYKWLIPIDGGFAYLTSSDGITWTLVNVCNAPFPAFKEIPCVKFSNGLVFAARMQDEDYIEDSNYVYIGLYNTTSNKIKSLFKLESNNAKPFMTKLGTGNVALLMINRGAGFKDAVFYQITLSNTANGFDFTKWFEMYADGAYYSAILQDTLTTGAFTEMYIVGGNGGISNHETAFIKLTFDASKPHNIGQIPFNLV